MNIVTANNVSKVFRRAGGPRLIREYVRELFQSKEDVKPFPFTPIRAGPQLVQQIEAINQKFDEAFNKHDAAAVGQLYTSNAVQTVARMVFRSRVYRRIYYRFVSASAGFDRLVAGIL